MYIITLRCIYHIYIYIYIRGVRRTFTLFYFPFFLFISLMITNDAVCRTKMNGRYDNIIILCARRIQRTLYTYYTVILYMLRNLSSGSYNNNNMYAVINKRRLGFVAFTLFSAKTEFQHV